MADLLYNFTEWLRNTFLVDWALAISDWPINLWIVTNFWAIPIFQVIHILSIAAAFGATLMMTLRMYGLAGAGQTLDQTHARYLKWMWWGIVALGLSGLLMIIGEPIRELINPIFWIKMALVIVLILVSMGFHRGVARAASAGGPGWVASTGTRISAFLIIVLWLLVMAGGRWIAYAPV